MTRLCGRTILAPIFRMSLIWACCFLLFAFSAAAQSPARSYDELVDRFFSQVAEGEYGPAVDQIAGTNAWLSKGGDQMTTLKTRFSGLGALLGQYIGHERIVVQPLGDRFVYVMELAYFEREPLQLHFTFYKPAKSWQLYTISYDEDADVTTKELARKKLGDE